MNDFSTIFPGEKWETLSPTEAGFNRCLWYSWLKKQNPKGSTIFGEQHSDNQWGVILIRSGYLIQTWGDPDYLYQSASVGKAFTKLALQLAIDHGFISSDQDLVRNYWTGVGELSHSHKYLSTGHHRNLTFRHLWQHWGGFPVTNGFFWRNRIAVPTWFRWTGDPDYDNYACIPPGTIRSYASGGYWRLTQVLTHIFNKNLKDILDEYLFCELGISAGQWDWLSGKYVREKAEFYPEMSGYGEFIDPPYSINNHTCVGGGGWVVMSPSNLARVGLLIANGGVWRKKRLLVNSPLLAGHRGGNDSDLIVEGNSGMLIWARVTTSGVQFTKALLN